MTTPLLLEMRGIRKSFGDIPVLRGVDFDLHAGEVHVLAGENGAGKSTLMKILAGVFGDYTGTIRLKDRPVRFRTPRDAYDHGIAVIYQELSLVESLSVSENLHLGRERVRVGGLVDLARQNTEAREMLMKLDLDLAADRPVGDYPIAIRQSVEITRATSRQADVLIMDEPTSALNEAEVDRLMALIRSLTAQGVGVVYITHKLEEVYRLGDRITVLRDGISVGTDAIATVTRDELIRKMVGREIRAQYPYAPSTPGEELLRVDGYSVHPSAPGQPPVVDRVTLSLRAGEVVGIAGLQGCGHSEFLQSLFGVPGLLSRGTILLYGSPGVIETPQAAIGQRIALLTNDRKANGLVLDMPIAENITLPSLKKFSPGGWIRKGEERAAAGVRCRELEIKQASVQQEAAELSGGNQQKVVFAKWLETAPRILLLDDPTRGVDVGSKYEIYELIMRLKNKGTGILLVSSETPELIGLCDRVIVMNNGAIAAELDRSNATQESILHAALGFRESPHG